MNALSVRKLTKVYKNGVTALKSIDLDVAQGDFFALLGQNGAGKSTTIGIITSLITKTSGSVKIFNYDIEAHAAAAKSLIGVVPQEMNFNLFENITQTLVNQAGFYGIPRNIALQRAEFYLQKMGIWEKRHLASVHLSGGMKRRLMIARAMMNEPKLLILDEPTAGVDIELRHILWEFLQQLNAKGTTIILTTHYLEEAENLCKHVAIIDHGEIIEQANMKTLINRLAVQTLILDLLNPIEGTQRFDLPQFTSRLIDSATIEVEVHQHQSINALFAELNAQHIQVKSLRNKTNRLEELFIDLVGQSNKH